MKLLLDTCTFLWFITDAPELSATARAAIQAVENEALLSAVSAWEIAVKFQLGKLPLPERPEVFVPRQREQHGLTPLPLAEEAVLQLPKLGNHHRDPFDRMLVCQALTEGLVIVTPDELVQRYPARTLW